MAIIKQSHTSSQSWFNYLSPYDRTFYFPCYGTDRLLVVCINVRNGTCTGVNYNGVALTEAVSTNYTTHYNHIFYLKNPTSGSNDLVVYGQAGDYFTIQASSYSGVYQDGDPLDDTSIGDGNGYEAASVSSNIEPTETNELVVDSILSQTTVANVATLTVGTGQTKLNEGWWYGFGFKGSSSYKVLTGEPSTDMEWDASISSAYVSLAHTVASFKAIDGETFNTESASVNDSITLSESTSLTNTECQVDSDTLQDYVSISDVPTVYLAGTVYINIGDDLTITESPEWQVENVGTEVDESMLVHEKVTVQMVGNIDTETHFTKEILYKVYDDAGDFVTTWTDVVSEFSCNYEINAGLSPLVIRLARNETDFGEDSDVKQGNRLKVYIFDKDSGADGVCVYSGVLVSYSPLIKGGEEYIDLQFFSHYWDLSNKVLISGTITEVPYNSYDPSIILRDVLNIYSNYSDSVLDFVDYGGSQIYGDELVALYKFDSGEELTDSSGNSHTLTEIGSPSQTTGKWGMCCSLDGDDAYSAVDDSQLKPTGAFSMGGWFKTDDVDNAKFLIQSYSASTNRAGIFIRISSSNVLHGDSNRNTGNTSGVDYEGIDSTATVTDGQWHHAVFTWDGSYLNLYLDGEVAGTPVAWTYAPGYAASNYFRIGARSNTGSDTYYFVGQLDEMFLLNGKALSADEVSDLYNRYIKAGTIGLTGTEVSYTFNTNSFQDSLQKVIELCPEDWYFRIGADDKVYLSETSAVADHYLVLGKDISEYQPEKRYDNIINTIYFRGGGTLFNKYTNSGSITAYGTRAISRVDERVTVDGTASTICNRILDANNSPEVRVTLRVTDNNGEAGELGYDIESLQVGQTVKILNATQKSNNYWDEALFDSDSWDFDITNAAATPLQIMRIEYHLDYAVLELSNKQPNISKRIEDINRNLVESQTADNPSSPS